MINEIVGKKEIRTDSEHIFILSLCYIFNMGKKIAQNTSQSENR